VIAHLQRLPRWERDEAPEARLAKLERLLDASRQPLAPVLLGLWRFYLVRS
jgi:hypothetical protein